MEEKIEPCAKCGRPPSKIAGSWMCWVCLSNEPTIEPAKVSDFERDAERRREDQKAIERWNYQQLKKEGE
jgi:hypothetical protein